MKTATNADSPPLPDAALHHATEMAALMQDLQHTASALLGISTALSASGLPGAERGSRVLLRCRQAVLAVLSRHWAAVGALCEKAQADDAR